MGWATSRVSQVRKEFEAQTGRCANMQQYGWVPTRWSKATGEPLEFEKVSRGATYILSRDVAKRWYLSLKGEVQVQLVGGSFYPKRRLSSATFQGPVAAAVWVGDIIDADPWVLKAWLAVERSNGSD